MNQVLTPTSLPSKQIPEIQEQTGLVLNREQQNLFDLVVNERKSVFVTARAGTGKSTVLREIDRAMRAKGYEIINVAFTGKAATLLRGGTTVSRSVQMDRGEEDTLPNGISEAKAWNGKIRKPLSSVYSNADPRWKAIRLVVVVDEIAQLSSEKARLFYDIGMRYRASHKISTPPIWVLAGDFGQFKCINGSSIFDPAVYEYWKDQETKAVHTLPSILETIKPVHISLTQVMRQSDPRYLRALEWAYYGVALHPLFRDRLTQTPPPNTPRVFFNNKEVVKENERYLKTFVEQNPSARSQVYKAMGDRLSDYDKASLLPIQPEMEIYEGSAFTVTVNVPDPADQKRLLVSNGEIVTVQRLLAHAIEVVKADGTRVMLNALTKHPLPADKQGKVPNFQQLPGYPGPNATLMKIQGETFDHPVVYGAWQWCKGKRIPLNLHGSIYVATSRNTQLDHIYFDTSFGIEEAEVLLRKSIATDPKIKEYLMRQQCKFYITDALKKWYVYECINLVIESETQIQLVALKTHLKTGEETFYHARYQVSEGDLVLLGLAERSGEHFFEETNAEVEESLQSLMKQALDYYQT